MNKLKSTLLLLIVTISLTNTAIAWDNTGHRVSAVIALEYVTPSQREKLLELLQHHPRYQQDFLRQMPRFASNGNDDMKAQWLLGQAAYWPDMARGLPERERNQYNHPSWHYIDGAWLRGNATSNGNAYVGVANRRGFQGKPKNEVRRERDVGDVMTGIDYNSAVLSDDSKSMEHRAIALCWFLHLVADLHQPLHTGSLFSKALFENGDRGGNGIETESRTLHSRWDSAISDRGVLENLGSITALFNASEIEAILSASENINDWETWLEESRLLLHQYVYSDEMTEAIRRNDSRRGSLPEFTLSKDYVDTMRQVSARRLGEAGLRMAAWFNHRL